MEQVTTTSAPLGQGVRKLTFKEQAPNCETRIVEEERSYST
ncbi:MAG: hypothetical protein ACOH13_14720 [Flavobacteriales bacterium]